MPVQKYNDQNVDLLASVFQRRNEPNFAMGMASFGMMAPGVVGFWPFSSIDGEGVVDVSGNGRNVAYSGGFSWEKVSSYLQQYGTFDGIDSYLLRPSEPGVDAVSDLAVGAWVNFGASGADQGIMCRWYETGNQRTWRLYRSSSDLIVFEVSDDGSTTVSATTTATLAENTWGFVSGVYSPSTSIGVSIGRTRVTNSTSIPASLFVTAESLELGRMNHTDYMTGKMAMVIMAQTSSSSVLDNFYEQTRAMFGRI